MRTFTHGQGAQRKYVVIDLQGARMSVTHGKPEAAPTRQEKMLTSESEARKAAEMMVKELLSRGFTEQTSNGPKVRPAIGAPAPAAKSSSPPSKPVKPKPAAPDPDAINYALLEDDEEEVAPAAPLARLATMPTKPGDAEASKPKSSKKKKKKKHPTGAGDGLDKRVLYGVGVVALGFVALGGWLAWDVFLKPPTLVATWKGKRLEFETGGPMSMSGYTLILDAQNRAAMAFDDEAPEVGTYSMKDGRLTLNLKDKEGEETTLVYKASLGRGTLELFDPESDKKIVQLVRTFEEPIIGAAPKALDAPTDVAAGPGAEANAPVNPEADAALASVEFTPKDGAFRVKHPPGWEVETGSRPDNTYSWARFTQGSARIQVFADTAGSLMSGAPADGQIEEGSEFAPVHRAHELYKKTVSEEYSDFNESAPTLFKGPSTGEGRIATFTAAGGGLFGSKLQGYRVTYLTNDRRITVLCDAPGKQFAQLKPTFLAVSRSISR